MRQLERLAAMGLMPSEPAAAADRIAAGRAALWRFAPPTDGDRAAIAAAFGDRIAELAALVPRPGGLVVTGGATLARLCARLEARALRVIGARREGIAVSVVDGGPWNGLPVFSKSGAFGDAGTLADLMRLSGMEAT
jgi:uncharacterized protein YgbK (DUF1537 family)